MSFYTLNESYDVHIFNCQAQSCASALKTLAQAFSSRCKCIAEYRPYGLKNRWFMAYLEASTFTIIHICENVKDIVECLSQDTANKVMCIKLDPETPSATLCKSHGISFSDFVHRDASTDEDIKKFVDEVVDYLPHMQAPLYRDIAVAKKYTKLKSKKVKGQDQIIYANQEYKLSATPSKKVTLETRTNVLFDALEEEKAKSYSQGVSKLKRFVRLPCIFGGTQVEHAAYVANNEVGLQDSVQAPFGDVKDKALGNLTEAINTQCGNGSNADAQYVMYKMLPCMYRKGYITGLASVVLCKHQALQLHALTLLEMCCLCDKIGNSETDVQNVRDVQNALISLAVQLSDRHEAGIEEESNLHLVYRVCNLLFLLQATIIVACCDKAVDYYSMSGTNDIQLQEIYSLPSETIRKTSSKVSQHLVTVHKNLHAMSKKKKDKFFLKFRVGIQSGSYPDPKKLLDEELPTQILVIVECLKQIFSTKDPDSANLIFLRDFLRQRTFKRVLPKRPSKICQELVLRGVAYFLHYSLDKSTKIEDKCEIAIKIIDSLWQSDCLKHTNAEPILARLIFEAVPAIRQRVLELYTKRELYTGLLPFYLIREVEWLVSPCFTILKKNKESFTEMEGWLIFQGSFSGQPANVFIHRPNLEAHRDKNQSRLETLEDGFHNNQLSHLQRLKHPNILALFAFRTNQIPQFYITENFGICLQREMKNRRDNQRFHDEITLMRFLVQVASALEYCHDQKIIHCNLTAASVAVSDGKALLGRFKYAQRLGDKTENIISDHGFLPTRWAAPESLRSNTFSKASDIWMMGCLIYEISTHGILPYSHLDINNHELVMMFYPQLCGGKVPTLPCESCLSPKCQKIIHACTQFHSKDRPTAIDIRINLEEQLAVLDSKTSHDSPNYPGIGPKHRHSSYFQTSETGCANLKGDLWSYKNANLFFVKQSSFLNRRAGVCRDFVTPKT
ncbi:tyrosine-protein kinase [Plakobranchus ocellatus]|uniref:Tyrosine-protein kinase n=1 Tax=Plakobranchus ocellatus TaxID=259542 RepID=A0AAV3YZP8_9GAST|nr:tyrosine-protein kinase [Plakobranchus ocellatus]